MASRTSARTETPPTPGTISLRLARAISDGNLDGAGECFTRDACFLTPDATAVCGREKIRPILAQLIASGVHIEVEPGLFLLAGEVAFGSERWRFSYQGANEAPFRHSSWANLVLQQLEGSWRLAIAAPWGREAAAAARHP